MESASSSLFMSLGVRNFLFSLNLRIPPEGTYCILLVENLNMRCAVLEVVIAARGVLMLMAWSCRMAAMLGHSPAGTVFFAVMRSTCTYTGELELLV